MEFSARPLGATDLLRGLPATTYDAIERKLRPGLGTAGFAVVVDPELPILHTSAARVAPLGIAHSLKAWKRAAFLVFFTSWMEKRRRAMRARHAAVVPLFTLAERARALLDEWLDRRADGGGSLTFDFFDYLKVPWLADLRRASLRKLESIDALRLQYQSNAELMEGLLQALFMLAVDDLHPEAMARLDHARGLNVQRLSLDPAGWDASGIFEPRSPPREYRRLYEELRVQLRRGRSDPSGAYDASPARSRPGNARSASAI